MEAVMKNRSQLPTRSSHQINPESLSEICQHRSHQCTLHPNQIVIFSIGTASSKCKILSQLLHNIYKVSLLNSEWMLWWKRSAVKAAIQKFTDTIMKHALEDLLRGKKSAGDVVISRARALGLGIAFFTTLAEIATAQDHTQRALVDPKQKTISGPFVSEKYNVNPMPDRYVKFGRDLDDYALAQKVQDYVSGFNSHIDFHTDEGRVALDKAIVLTGSRGVLKQDEYSRSIERLESYAPIGAYLDSLDQPDEFRNQWKGFYQNEIITNNRTMSIGDVRQKFDNLTRLNVVQTNDTDEIDKYVSTVVPDFSEVNGNTQKRILEKLDSFNLHISTGCQNTGGTNMNEMAGTVGFHVTPSGFPVIYRNDRGNEAIVYYKVDKGFPIFLPPTGSKNAILFDYEAGLLSKR